MQAAPAAFRWVAHPYAAVLASRNQYDSNFKIATWQIEAQRLFVCLRRSKDIGFATDGKCPTMVYNRIRRYESLWAKPSQVPDPSSKSVPPGFVVLGLNHLTPEHRQAIHNQMELYQWAYTQARRESDQKLFDDWSI